jgi:hypothetical protein
LIARQTGHELQRSRKIIPQAELVTDPRTFDAMTCRSDDLATASAYNGQAVQRQRDAFFASSDARFSQRLVQQSARKLQVTLVANDATELY